jgi:hypothetical protein
MCTKFGPAGVCLRLRAYSFYRLPIPQTQTQYIFPEHQWKLVQPKKMALAATVVIKSNSTVFPQVFLSFMQICRATLHHADTW